MNIRTFSYLLLIVTALVVVAAQTLTGQDLLTYLDLLPLILYFIVFEVIIRTGGGKWPLLSPLRRACAFGLVVGVVLPLFTSHLGWLLGFEGVVVNRFFSNEDPLAFVFVPFVAFASGIVGCIAGGIIGWFKTK
jgi:hypothetical protein